MNRAGLPVQEDLAAGQIEKIEIYREKQAVRIRTVFPRFTPYSALRGLNGQLCDRMLPGMRVEIAPRFAPEMWSADCLPAVLERVRELDASLNGTFRDSTAVLEGDKLIITLMHGGGDLLEKRRTDRKISETVLEWFGVPVTVEFTGKTKLESGDESVIQKLHIEEEKRMRAAVVEEVERYEASMKEKAAKRRVSVREGASLMPQIILETARPLIGNVPKKAPVPISEATVEAGRVTIWGEVFDLEVKETRDGTRKIYSIDITDYTNSITLKLIQSVSECSGADSIKKGMALLVTGSVEYDKYDRENVIRPNAVARAEMVEIVDSAKEKRVELHLHTNMSAMDGMTPAADLINQAYKWGQKAIAITDHGVAQAFPDAMNAWLKIKKGGGDFKVIYGVESYFVNDLVPAVTGETDARLDADFICFDLETTGLSPKSERITEIGAVRIHGGEITERFNTFVDPEKPIPQKITELTGITDEMVRGAPKEEEAVRAFFEFCGEGASLVAHNAGFDTSFLRAACGRHGMEFPYIYIDTVAMCRAMLKDIKNCKLDTVAKYLKLKPFNHHRACDDAAVLGEIFLNLIQRLRDDFGAESVHDINAALAGGDPKKLPTYHQIILVKNLVGLKNLYKLISYGHLDYFYKRPRTPKSVLDKHREGLILGSACEAGELFRAMTRNEPFEKLMEIAAYYDYLEIQPLGNNMFMVRNGECDVAQLKEYNRTIVRLGERLNKPVVATGDVHFKDPKDAAGRAILMAGQGFSDADEQAPLYMRTTDEMLGEFEYLGKEKAYEVVVTNPNKIADMIEEIRPIPEGVFPPFIDGAEEQLNSITWARAKEKYGDPLPEIVEKRLARELGSINKHGFSVLYMTAQKLVADSEAHGYLVGSRGSVGSSFVATMSGISEVNPLEPHYICPNCKYSEFITDGSYLSGFDLPPKKCPRCGGDLDRDGHTIPFETFLGFDGDKTPDIDLNFSGEYQSGAHRYTETLFGRENVFKAGTIATVADKTAFGYVKKYLSERNRTVSRSEENRLTAGCVGVRRTTGQHPGGLVVIPQENEIWDFCPVQHPADDPSADTITTHFEYHSMEENLLKLDMLGHDDPTMIRMMEDMTGVNAQKIPLDDKDTMSIFTSSKVLGYENDPILGPTGAVAIPEFNTRFTRGMLLDTMPTRFDTLLRLSGFSHGTDVWLGNAKDLITSKTATVDQAIGCRDDIMLYLISCGMPEKRSFKIMESVRKGRGLPEGAEEEMRAAGVPDWYIGSCKKIKYLFPKAHAVAYVMMAFRIAWFKVHEPLAFYSAYFYRRSQKGGFDAAMMTRGPEEVKAHIQAIDGNDAATVKDEDMLTTLEVCYEFYLRGFSFAPMDLYRSHATKFLIEDGKLLPPFVSVSGLGETAAWDILEGRKGKQFISIEEFSAACPKVSKTHIENLKAAGAFGDLPDTSQVSLF